MPTWKTKSRITKEIEELENYLDAVTMSDWYRPSDEYIFRDVYEKIEYLKKELSNHKKRGCNNKKRQCSNCKCSHGVKQNGK